MNSPFIDIHNHKNVFLPNEIALVNMDVLVDKKPFRKLFSAGIHPWSIEKGNLEEKKESLSKIIKSKNIKALGECDLISLLKLHF
jgi:Tat protein secretion system quality control protein TatD with DNase activity